MTAATTLAMHCIDQNASYYEFSVRSWTTEFRDKVVADILEVLNPGGTRTCSPITMDKLYRHLSSKWVRWTLQAGAWCLWSQGRIELLSVINRTLPQDAIRLKSND